MRVRAGKKVVFETTLSRSSGMALIEVVMIMGLTMVVCSALYALIAPAMVAFHRVARTIAGWPF